MKKVARKKAAKSPAKKSRFFIISWWSLLVVVAVLISALGLFKSQGSFCANSVTCIKDLSGKVDTKATTGEFMGQKVAVPPSLLAQLQNPQQPVLGATTGSNKHIDIDLTHQHLYAFEDSRVVYDFPVSTGKWHPTPTGIFHIWVKLRAVRMAGGEGADAYDLPNVPWTMFFSNNEVSSSQGFSIHGAYWHNNFGHPMSHGCVNMRIADAKTIFDWVNPITTGYTTYATSEDSGTTVNIYGVTPDE